MITQDDIDALCGDDVARHKDMKVALEWIVNNPWAHRDNMVKVARDALQRNTDKL